jgi:hypothetical protein
MRRRIAKRYATRVVVISITASTTASVVNSRGAPLQRHRPDSDENRTLGTSPQRSLTRKPFRHGDLLADILSQQLSSCTELLLGPCSTFGSQARQRKGCSDRPEGILVGMVTAAGLVYEVQLLVVVWVRTKASWPVWGGKPRWVLSLSKTFKNGRVFLAYGNLYPRWWHQ